MMAMVFVVSMMSMMSMMAMIHCMMVTVGDMVPMVDMGR